MQCLQLPFISVEEAVSWTQRFLTRNIFPNKQMTKKQMFAEILRFKWKGQRMLQENDALPRATKPPCQHLIGRKNDTTNLFGYNVITLYFSSQVRKQFKF